MGGGVVSSSKTGPDLETRLRGCAAILSAIDPLLPPRGSALKESNGVMGFEGGIDISEAPIASSANRDRDTPTGVVVLQDERTADFLDRQFRCLADNASGLTGETRFHSPIPLGDTFGRYGTFERKNVVCSMIFLSKHNREVI